MSVILFSGWYSGALCAAHPDKVFVFGDNLKGFGTGGQATIRYCPNAFGVPTKRKPAMSEGSFFAEHNESDLDAVLGKLQELWDMLRDGLTVVFPVNNDGRVSLGLERAELPRRAPTIYEAIERHVREMGDTFGVREALDGSL